MRVQETDEKRSLKRFNELLAINGGRELETETNSLTSEFRLVFRNVVDYCSFREDVISLFKEE